MDFLFLNFFPTFLTLPNRYSSCWFLRIIPWRQMCILTLINCFWNIAIIVRSYTIDWTALESIPDIWWTCAPQASYHSWVLLIYKMERDINVIYMRTKNTKHPQITAFRSQHKDLKLYFAFSVRCRWSPLTSLNWGKSHLNLHISCQAVS